MCTFSWGRGKTITCALLLNKGDMDTYGLLLDKGPGQHVFVR